MPDLFEKSSAIISDCGRFRYALKRRWGDGPQALFIMLNPSTADASDDDPTIRRCIGFAKREGCGSLRVENLYAFRATDPDEMFRHGHTAIGATNQFIFGGMDESDGPIIAAWGADKRAQKRARDLIGLIRGSNRRLMCLGKTKTGAPRHPLYVRGDAPLIELCEL